MQQYTEPQTIETIVQQKKKFPMWILVVAAVLIVAGGIAAYFLTQPKFIESMMPITPVEVMQPKGLSATMVFASLIRDDMSYDIQPNAEYAEGSVVMLYVGVSNFVMTENLTVDVSEDVEIRDSKNQVVFSKTDFAKYSKTEKEPINYIKFGNSLPSIDLAPGRYVVSIRIKDNIAGTSIAKSEEFTIVEKSKEIVERIVDLSEIVSANIAQTKLVRQQTVWGPDGNTIDELTFNETINDDLSKIDLSNVDASIKIPDKYDAGIYTVEIKYINTENGKFVSVTDKVEVIKKLEISVLAFADSIDDNFVYVLNPTGTYKIGQNVYVYMQLVDFAQPLVNGKYNVKFTQDIFVYDPNDNLVISKERYIEVNDLNDAKKNNYNIKNAFTTDWLSPGKYTYKAVITDLNNGQKAEKQASFTIT